MASFKYVIVAAAGLAEVPRIGTKVEQHSDLVREGEKVVAGGFLQISAYGVIDSGPELNFNAFGESIGLKVKSRGKEDAELIKRFYSLS